MNAPERNVVFVSHANPEENELALWLSLQLASEGYAVWCDLTKLLGGERFWEDIQQAISCQTAKFIYLLSQTSNHKRGTLDELDCAIGTEKRYSLRDFIITLKTDDLPFDDVYIGVRRVNHVPFKAWAPGLATLLKKLKEDGVPRNPAFGYDAVRSWWREQFSADMGVRDEPESLISNWFKIENVPPTIFEHRLSAVKVGPVEFNPATIRYPTVSVSDASFLSFAPAEEFREALGDNLEIATNEYSYEDLLSGKIIKDGARFISRLFRIAWESSIGKQLPAYMMANSQTCFYFNGDLVADDTIYFQTPEGGRGWRSVVGLKTLLRGRVRYWHYGITAKPILRPEPIFVLKGHVLFSDDRQALWDNKTATAKARRNQCSNWWNDEWRDRLLATMAHLGAHSGSIALPLSADRALTVPTIPITFDSPVSYLTPKELKKEDIDDYILEDEDEDDEIDGLGAVASGEAGE